MLSGNFSRQDFLSFDAVFFFLAGTVLALFDFVAVLHFTDLLAITLASNLDSEHKAHRDVNVMLD